MNSQAQPLNPSRLDESLLCHVPAFSRLQRSDIRVILDQATSRRWAAGAAIFEEGAPADRFYMLLDGYIRVVRIGPNGEKIIALHIPPCQLFGIAHALGRDDYPATAIAAVEAIGLSWPTRLWDSYAANYDGFSTETFKVVGERIGEMNARIMELATQHVEQRVAHAILRMVNQMGHKVATGIEIDFPLTRQDISDMTGTTLHTVSRLLSAWEKQGIVTSDHKRITVCQPHQLVMLTQSES